MGVLQDGYLGTYLKILLNECAGRDKVEVKKQKTNKKTITDD